MKIEYLPYKPKGQTIGVIETANDILEDYNSQGYSLTLRQLYYQFIAKDMFPDSWCNEAGTKNHIGSYNKLKSIISRAREGGLVDWQHIKDRGRACVSRPHWDSPSGFLESVIPQFHIDLWEDQPIRIEVWVEKDALSDVIQQACRRWDVTSFACKGYTSASSMWEAAHDRFLVDYGQAGQHVIILHLGDHDPSGIDMTRDIKRRLNLFSTPYEDSQDTPSITIQRIALNMNQVEEYDPPPNPAKEVDPRFAEYQDEYGDVSWELDALEPSVITDLIDFHIEGIVDFGLFKQRVQQKEDWQNELQDITDSLGGIDDED